ncbi:MAG: DOMON domain protein [Armatimonadetes bacterium]|nr:DOMON domain protein [Armatimonadota bacterium]
MRIVIWALLAVLALAAGSLPVPAQSRPAIDGKIGANEYSRSYKLDGCGTVLVWTIVGDTIYFGIQAESDGWFGIGFLAEKTKEKQGADQYIFTAEDGKPSGLDLWQKTPSKRPAPDEEEGGKNSILQSARVRDGNKVVVEWARKLNTGEKTDVEITPGKKLHLLFAAGPSEDWKKEHKKSRRWDHEGFAF